MCDEDEARVNTFVTLFDTEGFESIIDITEMEEDHIIRKLTDIDYNNENSKAGALVGQMSLRARFNGHRKSQVWAFQAAASQETLMEIAHGNPQGMADLIRSKGLELFGGYSNGDNQINLQENNIPSVIIDGIEYVPKTEIPAQTDESLQACLMVLTEMGYFNQNHKMKGLAWNALNAIAPDIAKLAKADWTLAYEAIHGTEDDD